MKTLKTIALGCALLATTAGIASAQSNSTVTRELILKSSGGYRSLLTTGAQANDINYTMPATTPSASQVLTVNAVSGNNVTLNWSAAGGNAVTYGPASQQATLTPVTTPLFNVAYAAGAGNAAGALISSSSTSGTAQGLGITAGSSSGAVTGEAITASSASGAASGLTVSATGTTTVVGASFSATGGTTNNAVLVSGGNVSVTASGGNVSLGPAATPAELRLYEPTSGTEYSSFKSGSMGANVNYTLPTTLPVVNQSMIVTAVAGSDVTLGWPSSGETQVMRMRRTLNLAHPLGNGAAAFVTAGSNVGNTPMSATVLANTSYHIYIMFLITETGDAGGNDAFVNARITLPSGTFSGSLTGTTNNNGHAMLRGYSLTVSNTLLQTLEAQDVPGASGNTSAVVIDGYVDIGAAGGTLSVQISKNGNANTDNYIVGAGSFLILER
ncbi:MAG: hypothetical protein JSS89_03410 [Bacteroidetes bacterium]|nr:hypothetical protein [Bacteroidota bacterium]